MMCNLINMRVLYSNKECGNKLLCIWVIKIYEDVLLVDLKNEKKRCNISR